MTARQRRWAGTWVGAWALLSLTGLVACTAGTPEPAGPLTVSTPAQVGPPEPGAVGFLGSRADLTVIDGPDNAPAGSTWSEGVLRVDEPVDLSGVWVKGSVDYYGQGRLSISDSIVEANGRSWAVVTGREATGTIDIRDSTLRWPADVAAPGPTWGTGAVSTQGPLTLIGNDISGTVDGVQQSGGHALIQGNWIHDLRMFGVYPDNSHNDGLQFYGGPEVVVHGNRIELGGYDGTHQNAAVFLSDDGDGFTAPRITDNYLSGGALVLRLEAGTRDAVVTGNEFGPLAGGFDYAALGPDATVQTWQDNESAGVAVPEPPAGQ